VEGAPAAPYGPTSEGATTQGPNGTSGSLIDAPTVSAHTCAAKTSGTPVVRRNDDLYDRGMHQEQPIVYPRARLDALTDGIYAVAMTLLVLDIRLPEDFRPRSADEMLQGLLGLWPRFMPYLLSFMVLGLRWVSGVQVRTRAEALGGGYVKWWLFQLLLITCVPFTTLVVGRYGQLAPAIWLYAGNTMLIAIASWRLLALTPELEHDQHLRSRQTSLMLLCVSALLCVGWSFVDPPQALWALALNLATPLVSRLSLRLDSASQG
jgi:uncharacterized membrane protein